MVKVERSYPAPASLASEKNKASGKYNGRDVIEMLARDFHDKCYICEIKMQDIQVEHLLPHKNGQYPERKFDWDNLFPSCPHCNQVKNQKKFDEGIIDCCRQDPEKVMLFDLDQDHVKVQRLMEDDKVDRTADLVEEVFGTRKQGGLTYGSETRVKKLQKEMNVFYSTLNKYKNAPGNNLYLRTMRGLLSRESEFAGFKRSYIREHQIEYQELYTMMQSL